MICRKLVCLAAVSLSLLDGCSNPPVVNAVREMNREAKKNGSPYRYRVGEGANGAIQKYRVLPPAPVPIPADLGKTSASAELEKDILAHIGLSQKDWGGDVAPVSLGVKAVPALAGSVKELWFLKYNAAAVQYEVTMTPAANRIDYSVTGPFD